MIDPAQFIADCQAALDGDRAARNVREVLARALDDPGAMIRALGEPAAGGVETLYRSPELTVLNVIWSPGMVLMPHNHQMWAVIGVYAGREDNILWRRLPGDAKTRIEAAGAKSLGEGEAIAFGADVIHSVLNPLSRPTGALHVYGGDFFGVPRSEWDPESLDERPLDVEGVLRRLSSGQARG
ncbi:MAG: hypothetical protein WCI21_08350 [Alphaproteobacteria bacterium]